MNVKRGHGWNRTLRIAAVAALGLALSACGGNSGSSSAAAQSSAPTQSSTPAGSVPAQGTSGAGAPAGSTSSGSSGTGSSGTGSSGTGSSGTGTSTSGSSGSGSTGSGSSGSGSSGSGSSSGSPPTASATSITINWNPPTENTDGSALTDLSGYKIYYGTASGKYTNTIAVNNPGLATYVVTNLSAGTYYFSVTAVASDGTESPHSSEVSATLN